MNENLPPCEPPEPADGRSCDCGNCDAPSIGWRWFYDLKEWLPACERHLQDRRIRADCKRYDPPLPVGVRDDTSEETDRA